MSLKNRRKVHKGSIEGTTCKRTKVEFGWYGFKVGEGSGFVLTSGQREACRRLIRRYCRSGQLWIRFATDIPYTKKAVGTRMGGGASGVDKYGARIKEGTVLFEVSGVDEKTAEDVFKKVSYKLPIKKFKVVTDIS